MRFFSEYAFFRVRFFPVRFFPVRFFPMRFFPVRFFPRTPQTNHIIEWCDGCEEWQNTSEQLVFAPYVSISANKR